MEIRAVALFAMLVLFASCRSKKVNLPDLDDEPVAVQVKSQNVADTAPGYGVALGDGHSFEVALEPADSQKIKAGESAGITFAGGDSRSPLQGNVIRVSRSASSEAGQGLAWLRSAQGSSLPAGEFVFARITMAKKKNVLTVPREAIYLKDGATLVLKQTHGKDGKMSYTPTEVETGIESAGVVEIRSGLESQDHVAVQGGIGYLFPNFKEADE